MAAGVCLPEDGYKVSPPPEHSSSVPSSSQPWAVALSEFRPSSDMNSVILEKCKVRACMFYMMYTRACMHVFTCFLF